MRQDLIADFDRVVNAEIQALIAEHIPSDEEYVLTLAARHTEKTIELTGVLSREHIDAIRAVLGAGSQGK